MLRIAFTVVFLLSARPLFAQDGGYKIGAYYFDGWTGTYPYHITEKLIINYSDRKPKWGWITSKQKIVDEQIQLAANAGLKFFSFCWYDYKNGKQPLNNALNLYLRSNYRDELDFCLLVANQAGHELNDNNWNDCTSRWLELFEEKGYLTVNGKPLLIFFSVSDLISSFGSKERIKSSFEAFRIAAIQRGLSGITIACAVGSEKEALDAQTSGFDLLTGYNYHFYTGKKNELGIPIDSLHKSEINIWSRLSKASTLKYIPVSTLGWDPRPWASEKNNYANSQYYIGLSEKSVYTSIKGLIDWLKNNKFETLNEKVALLYAWNEYGEGAYLTPSKMGPNLLRGLKNALKENK